MSDILGDLFDDEIGEEEIFMFVESDREDEKEEQSIHDFEKHLPPPPQPLNPDNPAFYSPQTREIQIGKKTTFS